MDAPYFNGPDERDPGCSEDFDTCACPFCVEWRANREPDEDDGEAFRGGEAAAFEHEQMHAAQRLKR